MANGGVGGRRWGWGGGALHVARWGEEAVAFHEPTASTHLFDDDTRRVVEALRRLDGGVTSPGLWNTVFGDAASESDCQALDEMLESLLQAGLVTATNT